MKHWHAEGSRKVVQNIVNTGPRKDRGRIFIRQNFDMPPRTILCETCRCRGRIAEAKFQGGGDLQGSPI